MKTSFYDDPYRGFDTVAGNRFLTRDLPAVKFLHVVDILPSVTPYLWHSPKPHHIMLRRGG